jgi:hypothetical protein
MRFSCNDHNEVIGSVDRRSKRVRNRFRDVADWLGWPEAEERRIHDMMALRLPFVSRLMVFEIRLEKICSRERFPALISEASLEDLHTRRLADKDLRKTQLRWEREKIYSGSMMLR